MRANHRFKAVAPLLVAALILAACGGAEPAATTTPPVAPTEAPAATTTTTHDDDHTTTTNDHEEEADDDHEGDHDDGSEAVDADVDMVIEVIMDEFTFWPDTVEVQAGQSVRFVVHNEGLIEHEFRLSNDHRIEEHIASGHEDHDDGEAGHHEENGDVLILVAAGEVGELVITFPEDASLYANIACLLPGHYEAGMVGTLAYSDA